MHRNKTAILALALSALWASPLSAAVTSEPANMDVVNGWIATPGRVWFPCSQPSPLNIFAPYFGFNAATPLNAANASPPGSCRETGQFVYDWTPPIKLWWVQLISNLKVDNTGIASPPSPCATGTATCFRDVVRVCSTFYAPPNPPAPLGTLGPCRNPAGIGPKGCEVCATTDHT